MADEDDTCTIGRTRGYQSNMSKQNYRGIHHVAVICSNYEKSKTFYVSILEGTLLAEEYRPERDSMKGNIAIPGGVEIELFSFPASPKRMSFPEACGLRHLAVRVHDIGHAIERLAEQGVVVEPVRLDLATLKRFCFFQDPDGLPIELYEEPDNASIVLPPFGFEPKAVIFDCDGTLVDTMPHHYRGWKSVLDRYECPFSHERFLQWGGIPPKDIVPMLNLEYGLGMPVESVVDEVEQAFALFSCDAKPIAKVLREAQKFYTHVPLAVASSGLKPLVEQSLRQVGIRHMFKAVVVASDVPRGKPHPDVFLRAAELLGEKTHDCLVFEDTDTGITAALRAEMRVVDIRHLPEID